jgi:hypothetical protein
LSTSIQGFVDWGDFFSETISIYLPNAVAISIEDGTISGNESSAIAVNNSSIAINNDIFFTRESDSLAIAISINNLSVAIDISTIAVGGLLRGSIARAWPGTVAVAIAVGEPVNEPTVAIAIAVYPRRSI